MNSPLQLNARDARIISNEPWYLKKIRAEADKNFFCARLRCYTLEEADFIALTLKHLGYKVATPVLTTDFCEKYYEVLVEW